jgi:hypothetical protein
MIPLTARFDQYLTVHLGRCDQYLTVHLRIDRTPAHPDMQYHGDPIPHPPPPAHTLTSHRLNRHGRYLWEKIHRRRRHHHRMAVASGLSSVEAHRPAERVNRCA